MGTRIWLKNGIEISTLGLAEDKFSSFDTCIKTEKGTGKKYVQISGDILDPTTNIPEVPEEFIDEVTMYTRICHGLRIDGIYACGDVTLMAKSAFTVTNDVFSKVVWYQIISAAAPSVGSLKEFYFRFREGLVPPTKNFEADQVSPESPAETQEGEGETVGD